MAEFVARSGGRLRGVAGADLTRPVQAVRELRRAIEELDFVALRIVPWLWELPPTDRLLTIVCGHIGHPWTTEMIAVADKHENVCIDTSAYTAHRYPAELVDYLRGRGRRKVLFGTDYPMITPTQALKHLDQLGLDEETRDLFLSGNARRVFGL